jgi:hypothetical protein
MDVVAGKQQIHLWKTEEEDIPDTRHKITLSYLVIVMIVKRWSANHWEIEK